MNLVKAHLAKQLDMHCPGEKFTVKRNNSYACLANDTFKMLDVTSYMSPGVSYDKFLKAFDVAENKGFFPYEWFDGVDKLNHPTLPSHEAFHSSLKDSNISSEDYEFCQQIWRDKNMSTFQDFLVWYNNLDVGPFVQAVEICRRFISIVASTFSRPASPSPGWHVGCSSTPDARRELPLPCSITPTATFTIPSNEGLQGGHRSCFTDTTKSDRPTSGTISPDRVKRSWVSMPTPSTCGPSIKTCQPGALSALA